MDAKELAKSRTFKIGCSIPIYRPCKAATLSRALSRDNVFFTLKHDKIIYVFLAVGPF